VKDFINVALLLHSACLSTDTNLGIAMAKSCSLHDLNTLEALGVLHSCLYYSLE